MIKKVNESYVSETKLANDIWKLFDKIGEFYDQVEEDNSHKYGDYKKQFLKTIASALDALGKLGDSIS